MRARLSLTAALLFTCTYVAFPFLAFAADASSTAEIQKQIDEHNAQINQLDQEIAQYQAELDKTSAQKDTLQNKINQLDLQRKKLSTSIDVTQNQIGATELQIESLGNNIADAQTAIDIERGALAETLRRLNEADSQPLALTVLGSNSLSEAWDDIAASDSLEDAVQVNIQKLRAQQQSLNDTKSAAEDKHTQLLTQQTTLRTQQGSLNATRSAQADLLSETKSKEANYQSIIAEKKAEEADFEETLNDLEAKLKSANTSTVPTAGTAVLSWPLKSVYITQYFGDTAFSRTAAYNGKGHNGIDLRASIGTPVYAALDGTVWDTNYGVAPLCQYGKWVLIKHPDGLTTLYAHLSDIEVSPGQTVSTGDLIGYSGDTGYATGPHLHFGVYNTSSVSFIDYKCHSGPTVRVPVAPFNGYLNPIDYLPQL